MAKRKPKTRFVIGTNVGVRELFSVGENASGDLTVIHKDGRMYQDTNGKLFEIAVERTSVHVSPNAEGTTIVNTTELTSGTQISSSTFIHFDADLLLWPFWVSVPNNPVFGFSATNPNKNDRVITLQSYNNDACSLAYAMVAGGPETQFPTVPNLFSLEVVRFRKFSLAVYYSYFRMPVLDLYAVARSLTSKPKDDKKAKPVRVSEGTEPILNYMLAPRIALMFGSLGAYAHRSLKPRLPPHMQGETTEQLFRLFSARPFKDAPYFENEITRGIATILPAVNDFQRFEVSRAVEAIGDN